MPIQFSFQHPASWATVDVRRDNQRCHLGYASFHKDAEVGRIGVKLIRRETDLPVVKLARDYADQLKQVGVHLGGAPVVPIKPPRGFPSAAFYAPTARYNGHEFDAPLLIMQHANALVALNLFGPSRRESPEWWAINKRAFEIVRDSLVIGSRDVSRQ